MGEIAEMMLDGTLCAGCGVSLDSEPAGYPVYCSGCEETPEVGARAIPGQQNSEVQKVYVRGLKKQGFKNAEIAKHLGISMNTMKKKIKVWNKEDKL